MTDNIVMLETSWGEEEPFTLFFPKQNDPHGLDGRPLCPACGGVLRGVGTRKRLKHLPQLVLIPTQCEDCGDMFALGYLVRE